MIERKSEKLDLGDFDTYGLRIGSEVYYARIMPNVGMYEIYELKIRTLMPTYFVGIEKMSKQAFLFSYKSLDKRVFTDRHDALMTVREAEESKTKNVSTETYYEED